MAVGCCFFGGSGGGGYFQRADVDPFDCYVGSMNAIRNSAES